MHVSGRQEQDAGATLRVADGVEFAGPASLISGFGQFASMAYVLLCALRRIGLRFTQFAHASCGTIRLKLAPSVVAARSARGF